MNKPQTNRDRYHNAVKYSNGKSDYRDERSCWYCGETKDLVDIYGISTRLWTCRADLPFYTDRGYKLSYPFREICREALCPENPKS